MVGQVAGAQKRVDVLSFFFRDFTEADLGSLSLSMSVVKAFSYQQKSLLGLSV